MFPFVVITILLFQDSRLSTRHLTDVTWQVPAVQQEMSIIPEHLSSTAMLWKKMRCVRAMTDVKIRKYLTWQYGPSEQKALIWAINLNTKKSKK
jgi:hypothetical protein